MVWARLDDAFWRNPKVLEAGNEAAGVYARALSYSADNGTLGRLNASTIKVLCGSRFKTLTQRLFDANLWEPDPDGSGGIIIHDYDDPEYGNRTATSADARSAKAKKAAEARWGKREKDANEHPPGNANGHAQPMLGDASRAGARPRSQSQSQLVTQDGPSSDQPDARATGERDHQEDLDQQQLEQLVVVAHRLRPDWRLSGIRRAVADARRTSGSTARTTAALLAVAVAEDSKTPRRILSDGWWWCETDSRYQAALEDPRLTAALEGAPP